MTTTNIRGWNAGKLSIRSKLIILFLLIKVIPLIALGWVAWNEAKNLGNTLAEQSASIVVLADKAVTEVGESAITDSVAALDERARNDIERLTTDIARDVANFLYDRDEDIRLAATLAPDESAYRNFLSTRLRRTTEHGDWQLAADGKSWIPKQTREAPADAVAPGAQDNSKAFHYRAPDRFSAATKKPLYLEMSFIDLNGNETVKVTTSPLMARQLRRVAERRNTFVKAETYFDELKKLKGGDIYVSNVIGAYVGSNIIGTYTPAAAAKAGIAFEPENAAYAGKENPVGKRFRGLVRWATPVVRGGAVAGYVTLALDHAHLADFTDHVTPEESRYADITDPASGNYAFIWDHEGRSIVHPRHHSIVGYDPETGEQVEAWLEAEDFQNWQKSGLSYRDFVAKMTTFNDQGLGKKPSIESIRRGRIGLDCRYLNFAPQCVGWHSLTQHGGSGSFVILWTGLWKLTTAAAIPYHTGQYGKTPRGFGYVTIGANVDEFHRPANTSKKKLDTLVDAADKEMQRQGEISQKSIRDGLSSTARKLIASTLIMIAAVIAIAIWLASSLSARITTIIAGMGRFESGEHGFRFNAACHDEMGQLQSSFNRMANTIAESLHSLEREIEVRRQAEVELRTIRDKLEHLVDERTAALSSANEQLRKEVEERIEAEGRATYLAGHDALTGLANRSQFRESLDAAIAMALRHGDPMALLFFDLDHFKAINDSFGHDVGDKLLQAVARTIGKNTRASDKAFRLGGDEFAVILHQVTNADGAAAAAGNVIDLLSQPFIIDGREVHTGTSVGISLVPGETDDAEQLLLHTDLAMYQAKHEGGNRYHFFSHELHRQVVEKKRLLGDIRTGILHQEFIPFFQPRIDRQSGHVDSFEALARWQHPEHGLLAPDRFIDIAEANGLLIQIDDLILRTSCALAKQWLDSGRRTGRLAVNISARQLSEERFVQKILDILAEHGISPDQLEIELTESAIMRNIEKSVSSLNQLRDAGIFIAIDDFGIDHSSLQRLMECPINIIKIDRFFVSQIGNRKSEAIIAAIIAMAKSIGASLVAEGVETAAQADFLHRQGCHLMQGYLYSRPIPAKEFAAFLDSSGTDFPRQ